MKVVKHIHRAAQAGYDKLRVQLETDNGTSGIREDHTDAHGEVGGTAQWLLTSLPPPPLPRCSSSSLSLLSCCPPLWLWHVLGWKRTQDGNLDIDWSTVEFSKPHSRPLKRHYLWAVGAFVRLSLPLFVSCVFIIAIYFRLDLVTKDTFTSSKITATMGDRTVGHSQCVDVSM